MTATAKKIDHHVAEPKKAEAAQPKLVEKPDTLAAVLVDYFGYLDERLAHVAGGGRPADAGRMGDLRRRLLEVTK